MSKTACTLAVAAFTLASAIPATAQPKPNEPSADHVKALIAQAQKQIAQDPAAPVSPLDTQAGPVINLTEKEAVDRGREKNLTLISERITPQTWDFTMAATRATYLPTLTSRSRQQQPDAAQYRARSRAARRPPTNSKAGAPA